MHCTASPKQSFSNQNYANSQLGLDLEILSHMSSNRLFTYYSEDRESLELDINTPSRLQEIATEYFTGSSDQTFLIATSLYDWTTANFFRTKLVLNYRYDDGCMDQNAQLDIDTISDIIAGANWGRYKPTNKWFMNSFLLEPVENNLPKIESVENIRLQLHAAKNLNYMVFAESRVFDYALKQLPKTPVDTVQILSRGAYVYGLELNEVAMFKPENVGNKIWYHASEIRDTVLYSGAIVTTRTPWSFIDNSVDAQKYSQGVIIHAHIADHCKYWGCMYITPFSNNITKTEWVCPINSTFLVNSVDISENSEKLYINLTLQNCGEDYNDITVVAENTPSYDEL